LGGALDGGAPRSENKMRNVNPLIADILVRHLMKEFKTDVGRSEANEDRLFREYLREAHYCPHCGECPYASDCEEVYPKCQLGDDMAG